MEKKIAGLLGAVAALGTLNATQASTPPAPAPSDALKANSYADLLEPIPNAAKVLQALDEQAPGKSAGNVKMAQYHHHHHHHHHHHGYGIGIPYGPRVYVVPPHRRYYHHHHHHHHHHGYYYRY